MGAFREREEMDPLFGESSTANGKTRRRNRAISPAGIPASRIGKKGTRGMPRVLNRKRKFLARRRYFQCPASATPGSNGPTPSARVACPESSKGVMRR